MGDKIEGGWGKTRLGKDKKRNKNIIKIGKKC